MIRSEEPDTCRSRFSRQYCRRHRRSIRSVRVGVGCESVGCIIRVGVGGVCGRCRRRVFCLCVCKGWDIDSVRVVVNLRGRMSGRLGMAGRIRMGRDGRSSFGRDRTKGKQLIYIWRVSCKSDTFHSTSNTSGGKANTPTAHKPSHASHINGSTFRASLKLCAALWAMLPCRAAMPALHCRAGRLDREEVDVNMDVDAGSGIRKEIQGQR